MAYVKKPPELVERSLKIEKPTSELLDDYADFAECDPGYVVNYVPRRAS